MREILFQFLSGITGWWPGRVGIVLRRLLLKPFFRECGDRLTLGVGVQISNPHYISLGDDVWLDNYVTLLAGPLARGDRTIQERGSHIDLEEGTIAIKNCVHIAPYSLLQGHMGIEIGDFSGVGANTLVYTVSNHHAGPRGDTKVYKYSVSASQEEQSLMVGPVRIGENSAVTVNCTLLAGADLGDRSWLLPYSLLRDSIDNDRFAQGVPAVEVGKRTSD